MRGFCIVVLAAVFASSGCGRTTDRLYWYVFGNTGDYDIASADATDCEHMAHIGADAPVDERVRTQREVPT